MNAPPFSHRDQLTRLAFAALTVALTVGLNWLLAKWPDLHGILEGLWIALLFSELALSAVWLVWGKGWILTRMLPPIVLMESISWTFSNGRMPMIAMVLFFTMVVSGMVVAFAIDRLRNRSVPDRAVRSSQFSVRQLLALTTCVATMFGFANLHRGDMGNDEIRPSVLELALICGCFALMALAGVWTGLGPNRRWLSRIVLPLATVIGLAYGLTAIMSPMGPGRWELSVAFLAQAGLVAVPLLLYRALKYSVLQSPVVLPVEFDELLPDQPSPTIREESC